MATITTQLLFNQHFSTMATTATRTPKELRGTTNLQTANLPGLIHRMFSLLSRLRQKYNAPRNLRLNQARCAFYKLPDELHLIIAGHLSVADMLSYAHCSQITAFLTSQLQHPRLDKAAFAARLRMDNDVRATVFCGTRGHDVAWCSYHSTLHRIKAGLFAPGQLLRTVSNAERVRVGARGRFRACEHKNYSLEELEHETRFARPNCLCDQHIDTEECVSGPEVKMVWEHSQYVAVFTTTYVVCRVPFHRAVSANRFRTALNQLAAHICPHRGPPAT